VTGVIMLILWKDGAKKDVGDAAVTLEDTLGNIKWEAA
jgi:hypothetical protein